MRTPDDRDHGGGNSGELIPFDSAAAAKVTYRLALLATVTAILFEVALVVLYDRAGVDHSLVGGLIVGGVTATVLARLGRTRIASGIVVGSLWLCAIGAIYFHGMRTTALPLVVISAVLAAFWHGARLSIALVVLACAVLLAASRLFGPVFPPPVVAPDGVALFVILGQFAFLAALVGYLGRSLDDVRQGYRAREQRLALATRELQVSREALAATELRYTELVQALPDTVIVLDADGRFLEVAGASNTLFGHPADTVVGRQMGELGILSRADAERSALMLRRLISGETIPAFTMPGRHLDGSLRWSEVTSRVQVQPDGERRALLIMRDATERLANEQALLQRETLWRRAGRIAQLGSWEFDLETGTLHWDEEVKRVHEVAPDFVPDVKTAIDFYAPEARPVIRDAVDLLVANATPYSLELPLITATGRRIFVRAQGEAEVRDGRVVKIFGIFQNITELHEATQLLRETVKLEGLGRLAGGVAHDFNNLLTAILGYAEELQHVLPADSAALEDVVEIRRAGERARELTMQLLAFARRQVVLPRILSVEAQLEHVRRFLERVLGEDISLSLHVAPDVGTIRMDPTQFEQLLLNLAVNARDAMPTGGSLTIHAQRVRLPHAAAVARELDTEDCVMLEVQDSGSGMAPDVAVRVFEPFFTTKELGHGTGLGLATVYGVVRQANGHIAVQSTVGRGTNFVVYLPRAGDVVPHADVQSTTVLPGGSETILLVEDDDGVRSFAERVLRQAGYDVRVAAGGADAEATARSAGAPIHLLVSDVVMPGMSGPELAERLERRWPSMRTLFVSGYTQDRLDASRLASPSNFLAKPYGRQQLLESVRLLLDDARSSN